MTKHTLIDPHSLIRWDIEIAKDGQITKMEEQTPTTLKTKCVECGITFEYPECSYKPNTCGSFECEFKHQHPVLKKRR